MLLTNATVWEIFSPAKLPLPPRTHVPIALLRADPDPHLAGFPAPRAGAAAPSPVRKGPSGPARVGTDEPPPRGVSRPRRGRPPRFRPGEGQGQVRPGPDERAAACRGTRARCPAGAGSGTGTYPPRAKYDFPRRQRHRGV